MRKQMTEQQAWEKLYGRRSPDVRVLGGYAADGDDEAHAPRPRESPVATADPGSEAHAA